MRRVTTLLVAGLMVLAAFATPVVGAPTAPDSSATHSQAVTGDQGGAPATAVEQTVNSAPDDPENDTLGWESVNGTGLWYNESISVDRSDGLNQSELDKVVARGMARVEKIRKLEFEKAVPVEIISREEYKNNSGGYYENLPKEDRLHQNVKWEAALMINESTDAISVQQSNRGSTVGGYFSPSEDRIVIISENTSSPKMDEITLAQELFHALQDQKYNTLNYFGDTTEENNAFNGIIEGDGNLVDRYYEKRCNEEWDCLLPQSGGGGGGGSIHFGLYFVSFQPYSDGPKFVQQIYKEGGWDAVNDVYDSPPESSEQVIHPDKYGEDSPTEVSFTDKSNSEWSVIDTAGSGINYASFGEAGMASMMFYPYYDSGRTAAPVVSPSSMFNLTEEGGLSDFDPLNYSNKFTAGWDGDRLYPYATEDSYETNETGYVWKTEWDSTTDAQEFVAAYEALLGYYGAEDVSALSNVHQIPEGNDYADSYAVEVDGSTVTIINAPSMDQLNEVRQGTITAMDYAGEDGEVSTDELQTAISHFVQEKLDKSTFQKVVQMWATSG